eukprot:TRINITY_DN956_c0_g1_i1.p2 TRINITY_DN956_c0_g1~~TRINITY_DN956_c0_g1_i1.p2  ORF type:complete len:112 (+),score=27.58 TRINITY_DN956_c0_g1_i1:392-727(+)
MAQNQRIISQYVCDGMKFASMERCRQLFSSALNNINDCLMTYFEDQVLDDGAAISCTNCGECRIFKKTSSIVRYPEIGTILFDRFNDGRKYYQKVCYKKNITFLRGTEGRI